MGNFMKNNYSCELRLIGRIGICQGDTVILKVALAHRFINQKHCMERVKHFVNSKRFWGKLKPINNGVNVCDLLTEVK